MNIENIEAFVYVIHYGSFNKASEALFLTQPSVTARIQSLERELDCKLFDRLGKQIQVTEEGKRFLPYAQQLLLTYQKGKMNINRKRSVPEEVRIGCTVSVSNYLISELLSRLMPRFPDLHFKIVTGITDEIVQKVLNREVEIGFVRNVSHPNLRSHKFFEDPINLYVYENHRFLGPVPPTIAEIAHEPFVFFECGALDWLRVHRVFENIDQPPNIRIQTDNSESAKKLIVRKAGISFLPGLCARDEVAAGRLFPVHVAETEGISLQTNLISNHGEHTALLDALAAIGQEIQPQARTVK